MVKETSVIEFACPMRKKMLEMKNEIEIQKEIANARVFQQVSKQVKMIRKWTLIKLKTVST